MSDEKAQKAIALKEHRRNFKLCVLNGSFFMLSMVFCRIDVILSGFVFYLTGSKILVGLLPVISWGGWLLPQGIVPWFVEHKERKKPVFLASAVMRTLSWLAISVGLLLFPRAEPGRIFIFFIVFYTLSSLGTGLSGVPFFEIISKAFPQEERGRLFGWRRGAGGIFAVPALILVLYIFGEKSPFSFPYNYGLLFGGAALAIFASSTSFLLIREPIEPVVSAREPFRKHMLRGVLLLRRNSDLQRFVLLRICLALGMMTGAFYMPFAIERLGAPQSATGLFLIVVLLSEVVASIFWGHFADKYGNRMLFISIAVCMVFAPIFAIIAPHIRFREINLFGGIFGTINSQVLFLVLSFMVWGAIIGGQIIGYATYMLEIAPKRRRTTFIGFTSLFGFPLIFTGLVAGYIAEHLGFETAFAVAAGFSILSIFVARTLREYRNTNQQP